MELNKAFNDSILRKRIIRLFIVQTLYQLDKDKLKDEVIDKQLIEEHCLNSSDIASLYQTEEAGEANEEVVELDLTSLISSSAAKDINQYIASLINYAWFAGLDPEPGIKEAVPEDFVISVFEIIDNLNEIDLRIGSFLKGWTFDRLKQIDVSILRLAFYEILFEKGTPPVTAVDEAITLARALSDDKSRKFISGVLGQLLIEEGLNED